ncbi:hypothetical protein BKA65DRAFT_529501 [Rhexocercosporidium sp. MPI-PUGE-AT-0058]|nr:hypothetical protein BKA65DRAFT_529501 [Rhexocercosporidium sp. MPI-PUGE-AT-0058]
MSSAQLVGRDSLSTNPNIFNYPTESNINITSHGADLYWAVCAVMGFSAILFLIHGHFVVGKKRGGRLQYMVFHYITAGICFVACIAYFTMASNLGYAAIQVEFERNDPLVRGLYREIFYVRYIDWVITTPLLLLDVLLTAGLPWPTILITIFVDEIMIVTGLVGALVASRYKWGYFVFAMLALFFILYQVTFVGQKHASHIRASNQTNIGRSYMLAASWTMALWFLYPIAWGLSEGGNVISPDSEAIFYSILDILAKPGFGAILLFAHRNIEPTDIGIHIRDYIEPRLNHYTAANDREKGHNDGLVGAHDQVAGNGVHASNGHSANVVHNNGHVGNGALPANGTPRPADAAEAVSTSAHHGTAEPRLQTRPQV